jgi:hypothetical protein
LFSKGEKWYDKLFNVKYLPLFHHFKAIYQFPKHIFLVKIVANATLRCLMFISIEGHSVADFDTQSPLVNKKSLKIPMG